MSGEAVTSGKTGSFADRASGGTWDGIFGAGLSAVMDAGKAIAVAVETQQLSVDPQLVDAMIKRLTEMQDELGKIQRNRGQFSMNMKIGGGYAVEVAKANTDFGKAAIQQIEDVGRAIESLKTQIEKSRASYRNADQAGSDSLKKINGKS